MFSAIQSLPSISSMRMFPTPAKEALKMRARAGSPLLWKHPGRRVSSPAALPPESLCNASPYACHGSFRKKLNSLSAGQLDWCPAALFWVRFDTYLYSSFQFHAILCIVGTEKVVNHPLLRDQICRSDVIMLHAVFSHKLSGRAVCNTSQHFSELQEIDNFWVTGIFPTIFFSFVHVLSAFPKSCQ